MSGNTFRQVKPDNGSFTKLDKEHFAQLRALVASKGMRAVERELHVAKETLYALISELGFGTRHWVTTRVTQELDKLKEGK